jgi:protein-S-isoprenylcysteine O-methyltransferase Ste14
VLIAAEPTCTTLRACVLLIPALLLRLFAVSALSGRARTRDPAPPPFRVETGPYRHVRHPLYLANTVAAGAFVLAAHPPWPVGAAAFAAFAGVWVALSVRESKQIRAVPAGVGPPLPLPGALRSERSTILTWTALILLLAARSS